ncbi:AraC family transcriptional regulator, partial [Sphingobacterium thalpophilum]|uniref:helix-turn-helix domain-containing protein n=1 Tax=Sphingobacterium thalpophilum TaxID=259 RepID=UPI0031D67ABB
TNVLRILMEGLYRENFTMAKLAELSNRSLSTFKRDFGRVFQSSPAKWILFRRLSDACVLLVNTDMSMSEIAFESGFETLSQFDKSFKRFFKTTPSAFRTNSRELNRQNIGLF